MENLSFQQVTQSYKENCKPFVDIANGRKLSVTEVVRNSIADYSDREKYQHADITKHILATDELRLTSKGRNIASPVAEFDKAYQKNLLIDHWSDRYDRKIERYAPLQQLAQFNDASTLSGLTAGESWRLYTDLTTKLAVLEPDIPLSSVVNFMVPTRSLAGRIPELIIKRSNANVEDMEEGAPPKRGRVGFSKRTVEMQKAGILLELSKEFRESNDVGVDVVSMFFERVGVIDEIEIVSAILKIAREAAPDPVGQNVLSGYKILQMQASFSRGKRADRVIGQKAPVLTYIDALSKAYVQQDVTTAGAAALAQPALINSQSRPTMAGYLDGEDATDAGLGANELLWLDSMNSLGMLTYQGDPYEAENFDVVRAMHQHVLTRWWAGFTQVDAPFALYTVTPAT